MRKIFQLAPATTTPVGGNANQGSTTHFTILDPRVTNHGDNHHGNLERLIIQFLKRGYTTTDGGGGVPIRRSEMFDGGSGLTRGDKEKRETAITILIGGNDRRSSDKIQNMIHVEIFECLDLAQLRKNGISAHPENIRNAKTNAQNGKISKEAFLKCFSDKLEDKSGPVRRFNDRLYQEKRTKDGQIVGTKLTSGRGRDVLTKGAVNRRSNSSAAASESGNSESSYAKPTASSRSREEAHRRARSAEPVRRDGRRSNPPPRARSVGSESSTHERHTHSSMSRNIEIAARGVVALTDKQSGQPKSASEELLRKKILQQRSESAGKRAQRVFQSGGNPEFLPASVVPSGDTLRRARVGLIPFKGFDVWQWIETAAGGDSAQQQSGSKVPRYMRGTQSSEARGTEAPGPPVKNTVVKAVRTKGVAATVRHLGVSNGDNIGDRIAALEKQISGIWREVMHMELMPGTTVDDILRGVDLNGTDHTSLPGLMMDGLNMKRASLIADVEQSIEGLANDIDSILQTTTLSNEQIILLRRALSQQFTADEVDNILSSFRIVTGNSIGSDVPETINSARSQNGGASPRFGLGGSGNRSYFKSIEPNDGLSSVPTTLTTVEIL